MLETNPSSQGLLTLMPINAELTKNVALLSSQSPYVIFVLGTNKVESDVCKHGGIKPVWNTVLTLPRSPYDDVLNVDLYHDRHLGKDKHIGGTQIILSQFFETGEANGWFNLYHDGEYRGRINLGITFENTMTTHPLITETAESNRLLTTQERENVGIMSTGSLGNVENPIHMRNEEKRVHFNEFVDQVEFGKDESARHVSDREIEQVPMQNEMQQEYSFGEQVILPNVPMSTNVEQRMPEYFGQERMNEIPVERMEDIEDHLGKDKDVVIRSEVIEVKNLDQNAVNEQKMMMEVPLEVAHEGTSSGKLGMNRAQEIQKQNMQAQLINQEVNSGMGMTNQTLLQGNMQFGQQPQNMMNLESGQMNLQPQGQTVKIVSQNVTKVPNVMDGIPLMPMEDVIQMAVRQANAMQQPGQGQSSSSSS